MGHEQGDGIAPAACGEQRAEPLGVLAGAGAGAVLARLARRAEQDAAVGDPGRAREGRRVAARLVGRLALPYRPSQDVRAVRAYMDAIGDSIRMALQFRKPEEGEAEDEQAAENEDGGE